MIDEWIDCSNELPPIGIMVIVKARVNFYETHFLSELERKFVVKNWGIKFWKILNHKYEHKQHKCVTNEYLFVPERIL